MCPASDLLESAFVTERGAPPPAETLAIPSRREGAKTMVSSDPQLAPYNPEKAGASQITTGGPPPAGAFFSLLSAQKPIHWPSGEKKGPLAPSVPAIAVASSSSNRRLKSCVTVPRTPLKTIVRPSGDNAMAVRLGRGELRLPVNRSAGWTSKM